MLQKPYLTMLGCQYQGSNPGMDDLCLLNHTLGLNVVGLEELKINSGWRDSTADKALAMHAANLGSICGIPFGA